MFTKVLRGSLVGIVVLFAACRESTGPNSHVGVYALQSVNAATLPYVLYQDPDEKIEVTGGQISLNADGTFSDFTFFRETFNGVAGTSQEGAIGTYTINGNTVNFLTSNSATYSASLSGRTITQVGNGFTLIYRR